MRVTKNLLNLFLFLFFTSILSVFSNADNSWAKSMSKNSKPFEQIEQSEQIEQKVQSILSSMTLEEKAAQMVQAERAAVTLEDLKKYNIGSVLSGGGSVPTINQPSEWKKMIFSFQQASMSSRLGIPLIYGADAVHGHNNVGGAVILPHNIGLGAANDPLLMKDVAKVTAEEMLETGVTWNFAPCVAVGKDARWGRYYESYSSDPYIVSKLAIPFIRTLQEDYGMAVSIKHFVADGASQWGTGDNNYPIDQGNSIISDAELRSIHLLPYIKAMPYNPRTVMISFGSLNGIKNHQNENLIKGILKGELAFKGFVISDWEGIHQIPDKTYHQQIVEGINAGLDMLMEPFKWKEALEHIVSAVKNGEINETRINDAVSRILRVKFEMDLFEYPLGKQNSFTFESKKEKHRQIAKRAVSDSLVLLKNEKNVLPLSKKAKIFITGRAANNLAIQSGGWTLSWQGSEVPNSLLVGKTILDGFNQIAQENNGTIITDFSKAKESADLDAIVILIGEKSYAEGKGDDAYLGISDGLALAENMATLNQVKELQRKKKIPVITIMIFGRPRIITDQINDWDALVMAWLPGTEGDGIAEVLYGNKNFKGKLPVPWAKSISSYPLDFNILFPKGKNDLLNTKKGQFLFPIGAGLKMNL
ncbi:MAG: glycoside hydrolase family 3 protein [Oligoflexia bacterium]|nr:glycoside hydrolase family 3 protein [Oligoflexia bacterium]